MAEAATGKELKAALSGKTIVHVKNKQTIKINADGTIQGKGLSGSWKIKGNKWCRTLTEPKKFAGTECQKVDLEGNTATFHSKNGRANTYTIK
ncbi:lipocalin-like domain-containing protein [Thalassovita sp.]|jgi:hypothetical protein|uniref:lipocalin-like domain-containing protein n=1 Tax=Thalassovita sp. TaxID=1979401 RepID=UPI003B5CA4FD